MSTLDASMSGRVPVLPRTNNWIRRHPVFVAVFLAYAFVWMIAFPQIAGVPIPGIAAYLVGTLGPLWAAFLAEAEGRGEIGIRALLSSLVRWRVNVAWYLIALFFPALVDLAGVALNVLLGGAMPKMPILTVPPGSWLLVVLINIGAYTIGNTEEFTWRGVVLPRFLATHTALAAALILAVIHAAWHLPYFFVPNSVEQQLGAIGFLTWTAALSIIFTWVFSNTRGSLLIVILFHAATNAWEGLLATPGDTRPLFLTVGLECVVAIALVAIYGAKHLSRKPEADIAQAIETS